MLTPTSVSEAHASLVPSSSSSSRWGARGPQGRLSVALVPAPQGLGLLPELGGLLCPHPRLSEDAVSAWEPLGSLSHRRGCLYLAGHLPRPLGSVCCALGLWGSQWEPMSLAGLGLHRHQGQSWDEVRCERARRAAFPEVAPGRVGGGHDARLPRGLQGIWKGVPCSRDSWGQRNSESQVQVCTVTGAQT